MPGGRLVVGVGVGCPGVCFSGLWLPVAGCSDWFCDLFELHVGDLLGAGAALLVADSVGESAVGSVEWVAASGDWEDFIYLGG